MTKKNFKNLIYLTIAGIVFLISGCSKIPDEPLFKTSDSLSNYQQESFKEYVHETKRWLEKNRVILSDDKQKEIEINAPFELYPKENASTRKGVLLVHGLGDSPFYLKDIAEVLSKQGFLVRTILLPGHGSRPADLTLPNFNDWEKIVEHHVELLSIQVKEVWVGGFSTGANLVTAHALKNKDIQGLLLFSPAFAPKDSLHILAPFASYFIDWLDIDPQEGNYTRYATIAMNGASLYSKSVSKVQKFLSKETYNKPVLIVVSESDSVIDSKKIVELFKTKFIHTDSRLIWYGNEKIKGDSRIISLPSSLPQERISTFSHMSLLFNPNNPLYGKNGSQLICDNGQSEDAQKKCPTSKNLWYSSFDYLENGKIHARLTWNPYFKKLQETIKRITE